MYRLCRCIHIIPVGHFMKRITCSPLWNPYLLMGFSVINCIGNNSDISWGLILLALHEYKQQISCPHKTAALTGEVKKTPQISCCPGTCHSVGKNNNKKHQKNIYFCLSWQQPGKFWLLRSWISLDCLWWICHRLCPLRQPWGKLDLPGLNFPWQSIGSAF